jgi:hypothetical protein
MAAIETIPAKIFRHHVDPFMLLHAEVAAIFAALEARLEMS